MKIKSIKVFKKDLSLAKPYTIAYKTISKVESAFMLIELEDGTRGIGAANPSADVVGETTHDVIQLCDEAHYNKYVGQDIRHFRKIIREIRTSYPKNPGVQSLWDIALHDAFCSFLGIPIVDFYGRQHKGLPTSVTIGIMDLTDTLHEAAEFHRMGFKVLKVKTGDDVDEDIARIRKLKEMFPSLILRVDANRGYTIGDLKKFIAASSHEVELIEQPLVEGKVDELLKLDKGTRRILAADESLKNTVSALNLASTDPPFGIYNIKLMKCGGIFGAMEIATIAQAADIDLFWGCNDESIVGITAALHAAYACPHTKYIDLDGSLDLAEDVVSGGFHIQDGQMYLTDNPGLGCTIG